MSRSKDEHLYGAPRPKKEPSRLVSAASSSSFASSMSSLLATQAAGSQSTKTSKEKPHGKIRLGKHGRDDIFTASNRGSKKRAAADLVDDAPSSKQTHQTDIGAVDSDMLQRSKRRLEEKARLYAAMKRGDYVPTSKSQHPGIDSGPLIDFDRKWAEDHADGRSPTYSTASDDDDEEDEAASGETAQVEYVDELGRIRVGSRRDVERHQRRLRAAAAAESELGDLRARPSAPQTNLIHGDTIQSTAFDPDTATATRIAELAARRDRSLTPPEDTHYDATKEIRTKGVGFYQFSGDSKTREDEMEALRREREETERRAQDREERKLKREQELEERRRKIREKRGQHEADRFLQSLDTGGDTEQADPKDQEKT